MKAILAVLWILTVAAALALGRFLAVAPDRSEPHTVASFREALDDSDWLTRTYRVSTFLQGLSPENLPEALEVLESGRAHVTEEELRLFMLAWSRFDSLAAFERALSWSDSSQRSAAAAAIYAWAYRDPQAALQALGLVDQPALRQVLRESLVAAWAHRDDKRGVTEYVASLPRGQERQRFTQVLAVELMKQGPEALMAWAEEIPPDENERYKKTAFQKASGVLASADPLRAARWVETHVGRAYSEGAPIAVATRWLALNAWAALEWLTELHSRADLESAIVRAFRSWVEQDPEEAEAWLRAASPAPGLDSAVRLVVRRRFAEAPSAVEWAQRIHDPELRAWVVTGVGRNWMSKDTEAAKAWLAESGLSEETQSKILEPPERQPRRERRGPRAFLER